jgi:hypothetical protein
VGAKKLLLKITAGRSQAKTGSQLSIYPKAVMIIETVSNYPRKNIAAIKRKSDAPAAGFSRKLHRPLRRGAPWARLRTGV